MSELDNLTQSALAQEKRDQELHDQNIKHMEEEREHREKIYAPMEKQEAIRRNVEALCTAARVADVISGEEAKNIKKEVGNKLIEHIKALAPIS